MPVNQASEYPVISNWQGGVRAVNKSGTNGSSFHDWLQSFKEGDEGFHDWLQSLKEGDEVVVTRRAFPCLGVVKRASKTMLTVSSAAFGLCRVSRRDGHSINTGPLSSSLISRLASPEERASLIDQQKRRVMLGYFEDVFPKLASLPTADLERIKDVLKTTALMRSGSENSKRGEE